MSEWDEIVRMGDEKQVEKLSVVNLAQRGNGFTRLADLQP
jgi:hypothetical protein